MIKDLIAIKEEENPFVKRKTESGIILLPGATGLARTEETGEMEVMQKIIGFGIVHIVGPDCKHVAEGDGIYYDRRAPQPVPFQDGYWVINEGGIRGFVKDDGTLAQMIESNKQDMRQEMVETSLSSNMPLGSTHKIAGEKGSGLKLV